MTALVAARRGLCGLVVRSPYTRLEHVSAQLRIAGCHVEVETADGRRFLVDRQTKVRKA